ncbi:MAG: family 43 glycosylhydrolase [Rikenellaceae bacterium]
MKRLLTTTLLLAAATAWAQKPILPDFHADPSAHYWEGKYWIYPSTDEPGSTSWKQMKRWSCYSSKDLVNWKDEGEIFSLEKISWADDSAFAPDIATRHGKYYYYFPASFKIGVAVSNKPNGPFEDALGEPLIEAKECPGVNSIDPCIFIDDDPAQTPYLFYGNGGVAVVKLKDNMLEKDGPITKLKFKGYGEGIWVHKRNDIYYFTYPVHYRNEAGEVKQSLRFVTAPSPMGPYTQHGDFFFNDSRNSHHSIIEIQGKWYLFYHIQGPSAYERRVCIDYLEYDENGLIKEVKMTKEGVKPIKKNGKKAK